MNRVLFLMYEAYRDNNRWFHFPPIQLCGMCGNYNHNASDDNLMPNKKPAKDVIELGNSWKSDGDSDPGSVAFNHCRRLPITSHSLED